jgi:hypothetical protein
MAGNLNRLNTRTENADLATRIGYVAQIKGLSIRHNTSSSRRGGHDGYHRWVVLRGNPSNYSIRSRDCLGYTEARFSQNYLPSIRGERDALQEICDWFIYPDTRPWEAAQ